MKLTMLGTGNALQRNRDEFEAATRHMREGIILLDEKGSILSINDSASRLLNATAYCVGEDIRSCFYTFTLTNTGQ